MQQNDQMLGIWRAAAKSANAIANTLLAGAERVLERQAGISRELLAEYADAAKQIDSATDMPGLLAIQSRLARMQTEKATHGWVDIYTETGIAQKEWLRAAQASMLDFTETLSRALDGVAPAPGTEPVMNAMKLVVDATRSSYAATAEPSIEPTPAEPRPSKGSGRQAAG